MLGLTIRATHGFQVQTAITIYCLTGFILWISYIPPILDNLLYFILLLLAQRQVKLPFKINLLPARILGTKRHHKSIALRQDMLLETSIAKLMAALSKSDEFLFFIILITNPTVRSVFIYVVRVDDTIPQI